MAESILMKLKPEEIPEKAREGKITIGIIGLGNIGLPTACLFADKRIPVMGADKNPKIVHMVNKGKSPIPEPGLNEILKRCVKRGLLKATDDVIEATRKSDPILIIVPTTIDKRKRPDYRYIEEASKDIGKGIRKGSLIMLQSTVGPGITERILKRIIEETSRMEAGKDFGLAYSPVRASVGTVLRDIVHYPRVIGAIDERSLSIARSIMSLIVKGGIIEVSSIKTAEAVKLFENIYRDVNIALASELAVLCEKIGVDFNECKNAAITQPFCHLHTSRIGVGGPCIPVNPYFLLEEAKREGIKLPLIRLARKENERSVQHAIHLVYETLREQRRRLRKARIAVFGVSFKPNVKDIRLSPSISFINKLQRIGARVYVYDPFFTQKELRSFGLNAVKTIKSIKDIDCIFIATGHDNFKKLNLHLLKRISRKPGIIIDFGRIIDPNKAKELGFVYRGIGYGLS